jgi:hypothetical protein
MSNVYVFTPLSEETIDYKTLLPPHYGRGEKEVGSRKMYIKNSPLSLFYNDEEVSEPGCAGLGWLLYSTLNCK